MTQKRTSTYSMWSTFANCQRRAYWRYVREMVPVVTDPVLSFGKLVHECLATWYETGSSDSILALIDGNYPDHGRDAEQRKHWHYATAMMAEYIRRYPIAGDWSEIVSVEQRFDTKLTNPDTGWSSHSFGLSGKIDMLIRLHNGLLFVVEHKTTSSINAAYIEALNLSLQSDIYSFAMGSNEHPVGVIYNVLQKPALRQYEANQRRKEPEGNVAFQLRLCNALSRPESFQRFRFLYDANARVALQRELWELSQRWLRCERTKLWLQNRQACFKFRKPCPYFKLCTTRDDPGILNQFYRHENANVELQEDENAATD